ncbi:alkaline phosphatase family protein [Methylomonas sp. AM2-LC]|uniref:alkaline phosphatase family protein n=1 Tax=Methylomonas sp. AM2-LC TaxID=3153301 RepID=UPI003267F260
MRILAEKIEHIVVLMLENRSFDSMLGALYPKSAAFNGLTGQETNPVQNAADVQVWNTTGTDIKSMSIPTPDPGELWTDINMQLFGLDAQPGQQLPPMTGFANNYIRQTASPAQDYDAKNIMHYYQPEQVPVLSQLAKQYAVCDQWFASAPCQTWPNRFFVHTGTANGYQNNSPVHFPYLMPTIFNRLNTANHSWGIFFHDFPQSLTLTDLWTHLEHFHFIDEFKTKAEAGELPAYSFIEPRYFPDLELPNDQHPPHHVGLGEKLIAKVYNIVRSAPSWEKTLLIITYDEHGGCYDHAAPPVAIPPDNSNPSPFGFDRYGVRVPAVLISPYISPGTILRVVEEGNLPHEGKTYPFDHTSILATLRNCFHLNTPLTNRDAVAPDVEKVFNLEAPTNNALESIEALAYPIMDDELKTALAAPMNDFQKALHQAAAHLPDLSQLATTESELDKIEQHIQNLSNHLIKNIELPDHKTPSEALPFIKDKLQKFLP